MKKIILIFLAFASLNASDSKLLLSIHNRFYDPIFIAYAINPYIELVVSPGVKLHLAKTNRFYLSVVMQYYGNGETSSDTMSTSGNATMGTTNDLSYELYRLGASTRFKLDRRNYLGLSFDRFLTSVGLNKDYYLDRYSFSIMQKTDFMYYCFSYVLEKQTNKTQDFKPYNHTDDHVNVTIGYDNNEFAVDFSINNNLRQTEELNVEFYPIWQYEFAIKYRF